MAAIYSAADRTTVKNALIDLAAGKRVSSVTIAGRTVTYEAADVSVEQLKRLLAEIDEDLARQAGTNRSRSRIAVSRKGL